ncbi:MAG TPA: hypothetical protein VLI05_03425 [Candidatus Saccharimonadia bacterium]|nr:hypothetical protein [Candidatus Saccharimonadia bacterium]
MVEQVGARDAIVVLGDTLDSLAAAAVLMVRQERSTANHGSYLIEQQRDRAVLLRSVVRARRLRRLPLKLPSPESLWADSADYPEATEALWPVLIAAEAAHCSLEERIQCLYTWIKFGRLPDYCQELAVSRREALLGALADPKAIRLERQFRGRLVVVQGLNCWGAHFLGFSEEPVVVEFSPKYADGAEPTGPRLGVWQSAPHYVDMRGVLAELGWSGDVWGGSFSSDRLSLTDLDRVCEVVRRHRSIK